jgi:hypothetical protein
VKDTKRFAYLGAERSEMSGPKLIEDICAKAETDIEEMGGPLAFFNAVHRCDNPPFLFDHLMQIKEALQLGQFAQLYNQTNIPKLIYACKHPPHSGHADFTVWDETQSWKRDLELTAVWARDDDFPRYTDKDNPNVALIELSTPRLPIEELRREVTKIIKRCLYQHARRPNNPPYWLVIYVNVSLEAYQLPSDYVAKFVSHALATKPPGSNVERVWVWNPHLHLAFTA